VFLLGRILERQLRDGLDVTTRNIDLHGADQHLRPTTARRHPCNYYIYIAVSTTVCAPSVAVPQPTVPRSPDLTHSPLLPTRLTYYRTSSPAHRAPYPALRTTVALPHLQLRPQSPKKRPALLLPRAQSCHITTPKIMMNPLRSCQGTTCWRIQD
jgi:hypothetical protein